MKQAWRGMETWRRHGGDMEAWRHAEKATLEARKLERPGR